MQAEQNKDPTERQMTKIARGSGQVYCTDDESRWHWHGRV